MRSLLIAVLALSASGAALAGEARAHGRPNAAEIARSVDAALESALRAVRSARLSPAERRALEDEINAAMADIERDMPQRAALGAGRGG